MGSLVVQWFLGVIFYCKKSLSKISVALNYLIHLVDNKTYTTIQNVLFSYTYNNNPSKGNFLFSSEKAIGKNPEHIKKYVKNDHLGNVRVVISDEKVVVDANADYSIGAGDYFVPTIMSFSDFYAFGMIQPGRSFNSNSYRYGYQNQEKDDEIYGAGNAIAYEYRIQDTRLGRFLSIDPLFASFPWNSPYAFSENRVISAIELEGREAIDLNTNKTDNTLAGDNKELQSNNNFGPWKDLLGFKPAESIINYASFRVPFTSLQPIEEASGDQLNLDYYSINLTELPKGFSTPEEFLSYVRKNFNQFTEGSGTSFGEFNSTEGEKFNSTSPVGAVMQFGVGVLDELSVITSKNNAKYWVFSPVFTLADLGHPVSGNRQFGITTNADGTYTFFTRGADRPWRGLDVLFSDDVFAGAHKLWSTVMQNAANYVNANGGAASVNKNVVSKRISWSKDFLGH